MRRKDEKSDKGEKNRKYRKKKKRNGTIEHNILRRSTNKATRTRIQGREPKRTTSSSLFISLRYFTSLHPPPFLFPCPCALHDKVIWDCGEERQNAPQQTGRDWPTHLLPVHTIVVHQALSQTNNQYYSSIANNINPTVNISRRLPLNTNKHARLKQPGTHKFEGKVDLWGGNKSKGLQRNWHVPHGCHTNRCTLPWSLFSFLLPRFFFKRSVPESRKKMCGEMNMKVD